MFSEPDQVSALNKRLDLVFRIVMMASAVALVSYAGIEKQPRIAFVQNTYFRAMASDGVDCHLARVIMIRRQRNETGALPWSLIVEALSIGAKCL